MERGKLYRHPDLTTVDMEVLKIQGWQPGGALILDVLWVARPPSQLTWPDRVAVPEKDLALWKRVPQDET